MRWLKGKSRSRGANPKLFDECIYTPWRYERSEKPLSPVLEPPPGPLQEHRRYSDSELEVQGNTEQRREDLIDLRDRDVDGAAGSTLRATLSETAVDPALLGPVNPDFDTEVHVPELFLFAYGTVVLWGLSLKEEHRFLREIEKFEEEKLAKDDVQIEDFNFYYTREYQARIYNDFISLRDKKAYMTKLAISHALAQSVKVCCLPQERPTHTNLTHPQTSLHESLLATTIATSSSLPHLLSTTGTISLSRKQINQQIGHLFILRISIHLQGSVLDSPELMWAEPQLEPVYTAVRNYLEMDQRVRILGERLGVLGDLLEVMRGQLSSSHVSCPVVPLLAFCRVAVGFDAVRVEEDVLVRKVGVEAGARLCKVCESLADTSAGRISGVDRHRPHRSRDPGRGCEYRGRSIRRRRLRELCRKSRPGGFRRWRFSGGSKCVADVHEACSGLYQVLAPEVEAFFASQYRHGSSGSKSRRRRNGVHGVEEGYQ